MPRTQKKPKRAQGKSHTFPFGFVKLRNNSLPQELNSIDFLYMDRPFLKTAVIVKGRSTGFRGTYFLHAESQRIKVTSNESLQTNSEPF